MNPALALANRTLETEPWARDKLAAHAGRTVRIRLGPASTLLVIGDDGKLEPGRGTPDLTLTVSPLRVPALLAQPERFAELVEADGDASLAASLSDLALTLPWFVEQALSRALGPVIGTRIADAGRQLLMMPGHAAESVGASIGSYVRDETQFALTKAQLEVFAGGVVALAERVDALALRLDALAPAQAELAEKD